MTLDLVKFYYITTRESDTFVDIIQQTQKSIMGKFVWKEGRYQFLTLTKYHTLFLLSSSWLFLRLESPLIQLNGAKRAVTFRSWMHYRILSQLLKAMRGRILRITFPQRPQTFGLRGLKVLHEGSYEGSRKKVSCSDLLD